jgi:hypothetical protein
VAVTTCPELVVLVGVDVVVLLPVVDGGPP